MGNSIDVPRVGLYELEEFLIKSQIMKNLGFAKARTLQSENGSVLGIYVVIRQKNVATKFIVPVMYGKGTRTKIAADIEADINETLQKSKKILRKHGLGIES